MFDEKSSERASIVKPLIGMAICVCLFVVAILVGFVTSCGPGKGYNSGGASQAAGVLVLLLLLAPVVGGIGGGMEVLRRGKWTGVGRVAVICAVTFLVSAGLCGISLHVEKGEEFGGSLGAFSLLGMVVGAVGLIGAALYAVVLAIIGSKDTR